MFQEDENSVLKWPGCSSIAEPWKFTAENEAKLNDIQILLRQRNPTGFSPYKALYGNGKADLGEETNGIGENVIGEMDDDDQFGYSQTQRQFTESQDSQISDQSQVPPEMLESIGLLKKILEKVDDSGVEVKLAREYLKVFVNSTPTQLKSLCDVLDVGNLSYSALTALLTQIIELDRDLGLDWSIILLKRSVLDKICNLQQVPPRLFLVSIANFADRFPRAVFNGVMVPCFCQTNLSTLQADILSKLFREHLPAEHQNVFLTKALTECKNWTEGTVSIIGNILESKYEFSDNHLELLIAQLMNFTHSLNKSLKFCKFIQSLIVAVGQRFSPKHCEVLSEVINRNTTFLKKTCLTTLAKYKH